MSMAHLRGAGRTIPAQRRPARNLLTLPLILLFAGAGLAAIYIGYVLWPRWPGEPVAIDAPSLPITISGVVFNVPPASIRRPVQRRPGTQERIDLAFLWPSLAPPDPAAKPVPVSSPSAVDRVFVTIAGSESPLAPLERVKSIYPRYLDSRITSGPGGLALQPFRDGTPYQGEALIYDAGNAERFLVRCTKNGAASTLGICLYERRIGEADIVVRFPRDWLDDWRNVAGGLERLIASLRANPR
jgi:hypothetical protein